MACIPSLCNEEVFNCKVFNAAFIATGEVQTERDAVGLAGEVGEFGSLSLILPLMLSMLWKNINSGIKFHNANTR